MAMNGDRGGMTEQESLGKITYEFAGRTYIVNVNEYGAADVSCWHGRGVEWRAKVKPGKTLFTTIADAYPTNLDVPWTARLDAAIADLRGLVGATESA